MNIPQELWIHIFSHIPKSTFVVSRVCKLFMQILDDRICDDITIIQNDTYLLIKYLRKLQKSDLRITIHDDISHDHLNIIATFVNDHDDTRYIYNLLRGICKTNNIYGIKYFKRLIPLTKLSMVSIIAMCYICLYNSSFVMGDYLIRSHLFNNNEFSAKKHWNCPDKHKLYEYRSDPYQELIHLYRDIISLYLNHVLDQQNIIEILKYLLDNDMISHDELSHNVARIMCLLRFTGLNENSKLMRLEIVSHFIANYITQI